MKSIGSLALMTLFLMAVTVFARASAADEPATKSGGATIAGTVIYGEPAAKIKVSLDGPVKKTAVTNDKGQFEFTELPAGEYKLECDGVAKNSRRKGSATVTVPEPPKKLDAITIKLQ